GVQQGGADTGPTMPTVDGEAGDPPDARVVVGEQLGQGSVPDDARERLPWPDPGPADRVTVDVGDETGRHHGRGDLAVQRAPVVRRRFRRRRSRSARPPEELAPVPRRVVASATEHRHEVVPPVSRRRPDLDRHGATLGRPGDRSLRRQSWKTDAAVRYAAET